MHVGSRPWARSSGRLWPRVWGGGRLIDEKPLIGRTAPAARAWPSPTRRRPQAAGSAPARHGGGPRPVCSESPSCGRKIGFSSPD